MKLTRRNKCGKNRRGTTAVEFAIVAPIIFLLVFGMMEWSRVEMIRQVSSTAAFSAARLGTIPGTTTTEMEQRVDDILDIYSIEASTVTATISGGESNVDIQILMSQNSWFLKRFFGDAAIERSFVLNF